MPIGPHEEREIEQVLVTQPDKVKKELSSPIKDFLDDFNTGFKTEKRKVHHPGVLDKALAVVVMACPFSPLGHAAFADLRKNDDNETFALASVIRILGKSRCPSPVAEAAGIVEGVWVNIWLSGFVERQYDPSQPFRSYLYTVARNETYSFLRRNGYSHTPGGLRQPLPMPEMDLPSEDQEPDAAIIRKEFWEVVVRSISSVRNPQYQRVLYYRLIEDLDYETILERMGPNVAGQNHGQKLQTIRQMYNHGKQELKDIMRNLEP